MRPHGRPGLVAEVNAKGGVEQRDIRLKSALDARSRNKGGNTMLRTMINHQRSKRTLVGVLLLAALILAVVGSVAAHDQGDRKSTRLNSSHGYISYAVFCLKKKK